MATSGEPLSKEERIARLRILLIAAEDHRGHEVEVKRILREIHDLQYGEITEYPASLTGLT